MGRVTPTIGRRAVSELTKVFPAKTLRDIALDLGIDPSTLSHWWYDGNNPTSKTLAMLAEYGVDVKYVITGKREERSVHSHWKMIGHRDIFLPDGMISPADILQCAECGETVYRPCGKPLPKRCEHCDALMKGVK